MIAVLVNGDSRMGAELMCDLNPVMLKNRGKILAHARARNSSNI